MTKSQERKLEWVKTEIENIRATMHADGEVKKFTVEETEYGSLYIYFEVGSIGDENDLRRIFCRESGHFMMGKRGGIKYMPRYSNDFVRLGKYEGMLHIHCAQNHIKENKE